MCDGRKFESLGFEIVRSRSHSVSSQDGDSVKSFLHKKSKENSPIHFTKDGENKAFLETLSGRLSKGNPGDPL